MILHYLLPVAMMLLAVDRSFSFRNTHPNGRSYPATRITTTTMTKRSSLRSSSAADNDNNNNDNDESSSSSSSSSALLFDLEELRHRMASMKAGERQERDDRLVLPVLAMDALLPGQRLSGSTSDPVFGRLLQELGLGGLFVMTSVNHRARQLRRNGCVARIERVDAKKSSARTCTGSNATAADDDDDVDKNDLRAIPTAVDFSIVGRRRCRVVGPAHDMSARVGRWRRTYDPEGEESVLGWGEERFVDAADAVTAVSEDGSADGSSVKQELCSTQWTLTEVDCALQDPDATDDSVLEKAESLLPLIEKWQKLASSTITYENTDVVATARVMKGQPSLHVDPAALLRTVLSELGSEKPPPEPTALALWGAALINPLPPLGVSPEIRGRILEAPNAMSRLQILEWGLKRSIANLDGSAPL